MLRNTALKHAGIACWPVALFIMITFTSSFAAAQDKPVATVNGEAISTTEFYNRLQRVKGSDFLLPTNPPTMRTETAGYIVLNSIINERIILQCAAKSSLTATDAEIEAELAPLLKRDNVAKAIKDGSVTADEVKYDLMVQIARFNLATERKLASADEIEKFYKDHIDAYKSPERWGLSAIRVKSLDVANTVVSELKGGKTFEETARAYSVDDRTRATGGKIGVFDADDKNLPVELRKAVAPLQNGQYTQPIGTQFDAGDGAGKQLVYWIIKVTAKSPATQRGFDEVKDQIARLAAIQKVGGMQKADDRIAEFRKAADVKINLAGYDGLGSTTK